MTILADIDGDGKLTLPSGPVNRVVQYIASASLVTLADDINREHQAAETAARSAIAHALQAGLLLIEAKRRLPHGEFLPWLKENCVVSERQAQNYMRAARNWQALEAKSAPGADLTLKGALRLLSNRRTRPWRFPIHEFCRILPWMTKSGMDSLTGDIKRHGLHHPITIYQGRILDGKCRYRACLRAGVAPSFVEFRGNELEALAYVVSMNLMRADYSQDQLAAAYVWLEREQAKLRDDHQQRGTEAA
jgi:hypothetical protein